MQARIRQVVMGEISHGFKNLFSRRFDKKGEGEFFATDFTDGEKGIWPRIFSQKFGWEFLAENAKRRNPDENWTEGRAARMLAATMCRYRGLPACGQVVFWDEPPVPTSPNSG